MEKIFSKSGTKLNFLLGFFAGLAFVSVIGFLLLLGLLFSNREPVDLAAQAQQNQQAAQEQTAITEIPKADKPVVNLFVMSHCPYGTQIEKGIIPVYSLLGDKIDGSIDFVYYAMHGEIEINEELNQYCIQKEQNDKFLNYLTCFLAEGDGESCLDDVGINKSKLQACVEKTDKKYNVMSDFQDEATWLSGAYPLFNVQIDLNEKYGVAGSPTLIINGQEVSTGRDSASLLAAICAGFNELPEECSQPLSTTTPSAGFGFDAAGSGSADAQCGG